MKEVRPLGKKEFCCKRCSTKLVTDQYRRGLRYDEDKHEIFHIYMAYCPTCNDLLTVEDRSNENKE